MAQLDIVGKLRGILSAGGSGIRRAEILRREPTFEPGTAPPGAYTGDRRTGDSEKGLRVALRLSVFLNGIQAMSIVMAFVAFAALLPLKRDVPWYIQVRGFDQAVVTLKPVSMPADKESVLAETEVAKYIKIRHEVRPDLGEMDRRWGGRCAQGIVENGKLAAPVGYDDDDMLCSYMKLHTAEKEYNSFVAQFVRPIKDFVEAGKSRSVTLLQDPIRLHQGRYEVRFRTTDWQCTTVQPAKKASGTSCAGVPVELSHRDFSALIDFAFVEVTSTVRTRHLNMEGFMVKKVELTELQDDKGNKP